MEQWLENAVLAATDNNPEFCGIRMLKGSESVCYFDEVVFWYKSTRNGNYILLKKQFAPLLPVNFEDEVKKNGTYKISINRLEKNQAVVEQILKAAFEKCFLSQSEFDCCSRYMECSEAEKCTNMNKEIAYKCRYNFKLRKGINFYKDK